MTLHIIISGKVQGVFYRASASKKADELGITGWIRNISQGNVEVMASGDNDQLMRFVEWCKEGPSGARVEMVHIEDAPDQAFTKFRIFR